MSKRKCRISYPTLRVFERAVDLLRSRYPSDPIRWKGGGREQAEQAIAAAKWAFRFSKDEPCYARKLAAAAALFHEIISLHPLVDGNKRLATLMLDAFLIKNGLPRPRRIAEAALRVAGGDWSQEDVYQWLLRVYRAWRARRSGC
ncbi:MAG: Fic family protein [Desulfurococcales archaeon]|nr:Fic family protein [Desulfurococcales archaeon]